MTKITLIAYGTRGDVQPSIALGKTLAARGHTVRLLATPIFKNWIESYGLEAWPAQVDVQAVMNSAGGRDWVTQGNNPLRQLQVMRRLLTEHGLEMALDAWAACQGAEAVISQFTSVAYAVSIAQKLAVPHVCMFFQPTLLATRNGRAMLNAPFPQSQTVLNYWLGQALIEPMAWRLYGDIVNQFRRETLSLPEQQAASFVKEFRRTPMVLGYSPLVSPPAAEWPESTHITGYWFLDEAHNWQPPPELARFLESGPPPVCLGFGSMTGHAVEEFTQLVVKAVRQSGARAVLLSGWAGLGETHLPENVLRLEGAPHDWLFPRVAGVVHHGGAGTTAAALRAGVPQLVVPHMADQPFWGERVWDLGVGLRPIPRPKLIAHNLAQALHTLTTHAEMKRRAAELGAQIRAEDGLNAAADVIEEALRVK